ncbi:hypothetical protein [Legionella bononiensis]|nr:hypothetical protein [Legionella bononiensis]
MNNEDSDMKYAVTFCTFDGEAGANPLWHSCILLSRMDEETKQLEVVDNWGFYGLPTTKRDNSWTNQLKVKIGLDVDLVGNHGMLRREEIRYLDLGRGLHGTTFELTQEQFEHLQNKCLEMVEQQESAIKEIVEPLKIVGKPPKETRIYPYEQYSPDIYKWEKIRAAQDQREPRLKPFEVRVSWGWTGPSLADSRTCKTQSLALLKHVLSDEQITRLTDGGKHPTVPRYSGPMETIYLHSTGPLRQHEKKSGDKVFYRDSKDPGVRLYWTVPPQEVEALSPDTIKILSIDKEYCPKVKSVVRKLQQLEWLLRNAKVPEEFQKNQDALINQVIAHYKSFSKIKPKEDKPSVTGVQGFFYSLLSLPRSRAEQRLQEKIKNAENLFNGLYMALVHRMKIDQNRPIEPIDEMNSEDEQNDASSSYEQVELIDENPLEAVVSYLSVNEQIELCRIIGRNYCVDDESEEELSEDELDLSEERLVQSHESNEYAQSPR